MKLFNRTNLSSWCICGLLLSACGSDDSPGSSQDAAPQTPLARIFVNEIQPSNQDTVSDEVGDFDDWVEVYNDSDAPIEMMGFGFSDSSGVTQTITGSVVVLPRGFQVFWADGSPGQGPNHLGFKLSASGDKVTIKDATGRTVDDVSFGAATGQSTFARFPNGVGSFAWCTVPTPAASNGSACGVP